MLLRKLCTFKKYHSKPTKPSPSWKDNTPRLHRYGLRSELVMQLRNSYGTGPRPYTYSHFRILYRNRILHVPTKEERDHYTRHAPYTQKQSYELDPAARKAHQWSYSLTTSGRSLSACIWQPGESDFPPTLGWSGSNVDTSWFCGYKSRSRPSYRIAGKI